MRRALIRLWNPPWFQPECFLVESLHLIRAYYVAAELGIADLLEEQPRDISQLAQATGAHERSLFRMLRTLAAFGVFSQDPGGKFRMTRRARVLLSEAAPGDRAAPMLSAGPASLRSWFILMGRAELWNGFAHTLESVKTGISPFQLAHGTSFYEYMGAHPELNETFVRALSGWNEWVCGEIINAYNFGRFKTVMDVGGGAGSLLQRILTAHPQVRGILLDQPETVRMAKPRFQAAGLMERCQFVGGNFRESIPTGADACVIKHVLRDWDDDGACAILRNCHRAMEPSATLLLIEAVVDPRNGRDRMVKLVDLEMHGIPGGGLRTHAELTALLERSGFRLVRVHGTAIPDSLIVEAQPVSGDRAIAAVGR